MESQPIPSSWFLRQRDIDRETGYKLVQIHHSQYFHRQKEGNKDRVKIAVIVTSYVTLM